MRRLTNLSVGNLKTKKESVPSGPLVGSQATIGPPSGKQSESSLPVLPPIVEEPGSSASRSTLSLPTVGPSPTASTTPKIPTESLQNISEPKIPTQKPFLTIPELENIPGLIPFYERNLDLVPDLIYILHWEGLEAKLKELFPTSEPSLTPTESAESTELAFQTKSSQGESKLLPSKSIQDEISIQPTPDPQETANRLRKKQIRNAFKMGGLKSAILEILYPDYQPSLEELTAKQFQRELLVKEIYEKGRRRLAELAAQANPKDPPSIIFQHPSQNIHRNTEKIQIELIKNEPEIQERSTIQCACGSKKVLTTTVQTRRGDEAPDIFARCLVCKAQWRMR